MPISLQGIFVLLFHCVTHREVRKHLRAVLAGKRLHLDDSATTRATLLTVGAAGDLSSPGLGAGSTAKQQGWELWGPNSVGFISDLSTHRRTESYRQQHLCPTVVPLARASEVSRFL